MPIEGIFFFGLIMGWPSLAELYKRQGVFENVCNSNETNNAFIGNYSLITVNCEERDVTFSTAGTLGSISMSLATFPLGIILDKYGTLGMTHSNATNCI